MSLSRRAFLAGALSAGAFLLTRGRPPGGISRRARWYLFGTLLDVEIVGPEAAGAQRALAELAERLRTLHSGWHAWKPGQLGDLNRAFAQGRSLRVDPELARLVTGTQELHRRSGGLFNPAIGDVVRLWGFHGDRLPVGPPPAGHEIERLLDREPSPQAIRIQGRRLSSGNPAVRLDLGGYGKGRALDLALDHLASRGLRNAIVNAGGDLCASGRPAGRPWRIGVRHPQRAGTIARIETHGREAVLTSGNYERYRSHGARRYPHILDPRSGRPVGEIASATVVHPDASVADAAATAIVVAGTRDWPATARALGVEDAMVVDARGRTQLTRRMAERIELEPGARRQAATVA